MKKLLMSLLLFSAFPLIAMQAPSQNKLLNNPTAEINSPENHSNKRKADENIAAATVTPFYRKIYFDPEEIKKAINDLLMQEEGKIWAAYYMVTSDELTDGWIARKYVQHYEKAKKYNNIKGLIAAAKQLTKPKDDILIVDKENLQKDTSALKKLSEHGIRILVRNKQRNPNSRFEQMHLKFMIIFDENNKQPKLMIKGSYNYTNQAQYNFEDVEITNDIDVMQAYQEQHIKLRDYCEEFQKLPAQT